MSTVEEIESKYKYCAVCKILCPLKWNGHSRRTEIKRHDDQELVIVEHPETLGVCCYIVPGFGCLGLLLDCCGSAVSVTKINKEGLMVETNYGCCGSKLSYADAIGLEYSGQPVKMIKNQRYYRYWSNLYLVNSQRFRLVAMTVPGDVKEAVNTFLQERRAACGISDLITEDPHVFEFDLHAVAMAMSEAGHRQETMSQQMQGMNPGQQQMQQLIIQQIEGMPPQQIKQMIAQKTQGMAHQQTPRPMQEMITQRSQGAVPPHMQGLVPGQGMQGNIPISTPIHETVQPNSHSQFGEANNCTHYDPMFMNHNDQASRQPTENPLPSSTGGRFSEQGVMDMDSPLYSSYVI